MSALGQPVAKAPAKTAGKENKENAAPRSKLLPKKSALKASKTPGPASSKRPGTASRSPGVGARARGEHRGRDYFGAWGLHPLAAAEEPTQVEFAEMLEEEEDGSNFRDAGLGFVGGKSPKVSVADVIAADFSPPPVSQGIGMDLPPVQVERYQAPTRASGASGGGPMRSKELQRGSGGSIWSEEVSQIHVEIFP